MEVQDAKDLMQAWNEYKATNDAMLVEVKKYGTASGELVAKFEKLETRFASLDTSYADQLKELAKKEFAEKLAERLDRIEAAMNRKGVRGAAGSGDKDEQLVLRKAAFFAALKWQGLSVHSPMGKSIEQALSPDEFKALTVSQDTAGGFLAPPEYVADILTDVVEWSPIRALCATRSTTRNELQIPRRTGTASASWVGETGTRSETTNPSFGLETIRTHEMYGMVSVSKQELEDSIFNLEAFLRSELSEQFGVLEGTALVSGNAVGKPEGFLTNASVTYTASGHASELTPDGLISLYYDLKEAYLNNATWVLSRSTLKEVRKMKDGNGNYLWAPGIRTEARPPAILDRPYITAIDMPSIAANAYPICFGDFRRAMMVVDRINMEMMVDPYSSKSTGMVEFSARRRVGAQVLVAEAIRKMKVAVS